MTTVARDSTNRRSRRFRRPDHCRLHPRFSTNWRYESSNSELVRKYFSAYENKDRKAVESLLSNDFVFTSPHDYRIYRETYFKLDWPYSEKSPTYLAFVELETKAAGMLDYATDLRYPNFAKMAEAAGVLGLKANAP
jgi:hypothetical protein